MIGSCSISLAAARERGSDRQAATVRTKKNEARGNLHVTLTFERNQTATAYAGYAPSAPPMPSAPYGAPPPAAYPQPAGYPPVGYPPQAGYPPPAASYPSYPPPAAAGPPGYPPAAYPPPAAAAPPGARMRGSDEILCVSNRHTSEQAGVRVQVHGLHVAP